VADENENYWRDQTGLRLSGTPRSAETRDLIEVPCFTPSPFTSEFWDDFRRTSDQDRRGILERWLANRRTAPDGSEAATVLDEQIGQLTAALTTGSPPLLDPAAAQIRLREGAAAGGSSLYKHEQPESVPTCYRQSRGDDSRSLAQGESSTVAAIKVALDSDHRKQAVQLRIGLDGCSVKTLWSEAFSSRRCKPKTMQTAFNRWQASRKDAPSWADDLMLARLLK
jgi:hypothetical protein